MVLQQPEAHFIVARLVGERCLFALAEVREILPMMQLSETQRVGGRCLGVGKLRGSLLPVFDPWAECSPRALDPSRLIIVLQDAQGDLTGVAVDDVVELTQVEPRQVLRHPDGRGGDMVSVSLDDGVAPVLTVEVVRGGV